MYGHFDLLRDLKTSYESQESELFRLLDDSKRLVSLLTSYVNVALSRKRWTPPEVFDCILDHLNPKEIIPVSHVCPEWKVYCCLYWKRKLNQVLRKCEKVPNLVEIDSLQAREVNLMVCLQQLKEIRFSIRWFLTRML